MTADAENSQQTFLQASLNIDKLWSLEIANMKDYDIRNGILYLMFCRYYGILKETEAVWYICWKGFSYFEYIKYQFFVIFNQRPITPITHFLCNISIFFN